MEYHALLLFRSVRTYLSAKRKLRGYSQEEPEDTNKCNKKTEKTEEKEVGKDYSKCILIRVQNAKICFY